MKIKVITYSDSATNPGWLNFEKSLKLFGWDYELLVEPWQGYGTKMLSIYEHIKNGGADGYDLIINPDSHDFLMLTTPEEVIDKYTSRFRGSMVIHAERACYPYGEWTHLYPKCGTIFKHCNGGGFVCTPNQYMEYIESGYEEMLDHSFNDQVYLSKMYILARDKFRLVLDSSCEIFGSVAHASETDFSWENKRLTNNLTGTKPCMIHFNGKTKDNYSHLLFAE